MEKISKPELTNFLRYLDKKKLLFPRIRYASVRSKSEILVDMKKQFHARDNEPDCVFPEACSCVSWGVLWSDLEAFFCEPGRLCGHASILDKTWSSDGDVLIISGVISSAFQFSSSCFFLHVSKTMHSCSPKFFKPNIAVLELFCVYSKDKTLASPFIGRLKTNNWSRLLLHLLLIAV